MSEELWPDCHEWWLGRLGVTELLEVLQIQQLHTYLFVVNCMNLHVGKAVDAKLKLSKFSGNFLHLYLLHTHFKCGQENTKNIT